MVHCLCKTNFHSHLHISLLWVYMCYACCKHFLTLAILIGFFVRTLLYAYSFSLNQINVIMFISFFMHVVVHIRISVLACVYASGLCMSQTCAYQNLLFTNMFKERVFINVFVAHSMFQCNVSYMCFCDVLPTNCFNQLS